MRLTTTLAAAAVTASTIAATTGVAAADSSWSTKHFADYETTVCWSIDNPDFTRPDKADWPQTRHNDGPCDVPAASCSGGKFQQDTYWIRDQADADYLSGLTHLNSSADDQRLEPHGYFVFSNLPDASLCQPPKTKRAWVSLERYCNTVRVHARHNAKLNAHTHHAGTHRFTFKATNGAVFGNGASTRIKTAHVKTGQACGGGTGS